MTNVNREVSLILLFLDCGQLPKKTISMRLSLRLWNIVDVGFSFLLFMVAIVASFCDNNGLYHFLLIMVIKKGRKY